MVISSLPAGRLSSNSQRFETLLDLVHLVNFNQFHPRTVEKRPCEFFVPTLYFKARVETRALELARGRKPSGGNIFASSQSIYTKLAPIRDIARPSGLAKFKKKSPNHFEETTV